MSVITAEERIVLTEFKERVKDALQNKDQHEDLYLLRWLRARDMDIRKAEDMLRNSLKWREENNVDKVLGVELDPFVKKEFPYFIEEVDKNNQPIVIMQVGKYDFRKPVAAGKIEEFKTYFNYFYELLMQKIKAQNINRDPKLAPITQFTAIVDWSGFSYMQLFNLRAVQAMLICASLYEAHYPEILFRSFFVNCPSFFGIVLDLLKPILAPRTLSKITIFGWRRDEWEAAIREEIDDENVSKILQRIAPA